MAAVTTWQQTLLSHVEGEAIALLRAMEEACDRGFVHVQFESNSQFLVDAIPLKQRCNLNMR
jgi:ribonuclease HI